jgi:AraC-like DNA-binding protein
MTVLKREPALRYLEYPPTPLLARHVKCFWVMEDADAVVKAKVDRIVPDGCPELVIHYGSVFTEVGPAGRPLFQPRSLFAGQLTRPLLLKSTGPVATIGVRFLPGGAVPFLGLTMHEVLDRRLPLEMVWGSATNRLEECIWAARTDQERVSILERYLAQRLRESRVLSHDDPVNRCIAALHAAAGQLPLDRLATLAGLSHRQLERRFKTAVGLSPKMLSRILRFHSVVAQIREGTMWSELALRAGFFDQAHLINDFQQFAGLSPVAYLLSETHMARCFTQAPCFHS